MPGLPLTQGSWLMLGRLLLTLRANIAADRALNNSLDKRLDKISVLHAMK